MSFIIMRCYSILFQKRRFFSVRTTLKNAKRSRDNDKKMRNFLMRRGGMTKIARGKSIFFNDVDERRKKESKGCKLRIFPSKVGLLH